MPEGWKQWEGRVVNEEFPLLRYLGGSERSAVFLSKRANGELQEVAIKLILTNAENPELQLSWWELAAKLSHPHLLRLFRPGRCQVDGTDLLYVVTEYAEESLAQILHFLFVNPQVAVACHAELGIGEQFAPGEHVGDMGVDHGREQAERHPALR